tara:strand:+ start:451 stop:843 length:393 start_codon:yes stop_codon:yes gene_type:complete
MNLAKQKLYLNPSVYIGKSKRHRWGVFAEQDIKQFDVIQESPYCTFAQEEIEEDGELIRYCYESSDSMRTDEMIIGFGFAALFNHSCDDSNAAYDLDTVNEVMRHFATEDIAAGSEILINYGYDDDEFDD